MGMKKKLRTAEWKETQVLKELRERAKVLQERSQKVIEEDKEEDQDE